MLAGRFRVEHLIGTGSMGVVWAARHIELDTRVAIKAIRAEMQLLPGVVSRFAREAKAAVAIRSEHVAQVLDVGTDDTLGPYIVMEYLEGRDLRSLLELEGRIPLRRAVDYVLQACEALAAAHANGIIHRDIKPENLFLSRQGELELVKLLDFGISKAALTGQLFGGELSAEESPCLLGTPLYMSPEQIHSVEQVDQRADIWSLGAVLYELVTGHSAYSATESLPALLKSILETAPAPLAEHGSESEAALQGVLDVCLEKNAARRFQNVADLAYALLPFASSRARRHAQRAAAILGTREATESAAMASPIPVPPPTAAPQRVPASPSPVASSRARTLAMPLVRLAGAAPLRALASGARLRLLPTALLSGLRSRRVGPRVAAFAGLALAVLAVGWLALRQATSLEVHAEPIAVSAPAVAVPVSVPTAAAGALPLAAEAVVSEAPVPALPVSRTVLVESQPSGAVVKIEGQVIGITPLSTLLPPTSVTLSLEKPGYATAQTSLQVEPAGRGAKPIHTRVVLQQAAREPARAAAAARPPARAARAQKTKALPAPASSARGSKATASQAPASPANGSPRPQRPRLRLVEDLP